MSTMSIYSPDYDPASGYGHMTRAIIGELNKRGIAVNVFSTPRGTISYGDDDPLSGHLSQVVQMMAGGLLLGYPTLHAEYGGMANIGRRLALTMFEGDTLPDGWVEALNRCDAVIVPTRRNERIFRDNGVRVPIHVIPLGVDSCFDIERPPATDHPLSAYPRKREWVGGRVVVRRHSTIPTPTNPFIFVTWGDRNDRKGWDLALQAFVKAFRHRDDVMLVIKTRANSQDIPFDIRVKGVQVVRADMDDATLNDFYLRCDAMVFPSRGEGFGLPPREFARTGGTSIVTAWWCDEDVKDWAYPVDYALGDAWRGYPQFTCGGQWANADIDHLAEQMKTAFYMPSHKLAEGGYYAMKYVKDHFTWERFIDGVLEVWKGFDHASTARTVGVHQTADE